MGRCGTTPNRDGDAFCDDGAAGWCGWGLFIVFANTGALGFTVIPSTPYYPLVNVYITMGNHHFLMGKLTISMVIFHSYVTNYQRVSQLRAVASSSQAHQGREGMEWMEWRQTLWIMGL